MPTHLDIRSDLRDNPRCLVLADSEPRDHARALVRARRMVTNAIAIISEARTHQSTAPSSRFGKLKADAQSDVSQTATIAFATLPRPGVYNWRPLATSGRPFSHPLRSGAKAPATSRWISAALKASTLPRRRDDDQHPCRSKFVDEECVDGSRGSRGVPIRVRVQQDRASAVLQAARVFLGLDRRCTPTLDVRQAPPRRRRRRGLEMSIPSTRDRRRYQLVYPRRIVVANAKQHAIDGLEPASPAGRSLCG